MSSESRKPKLTFNQAMKEVLNGTIESVTSGKIFGGLKLLNSKTVERVKKVFAIKPDEVIMVEAQPHLKMALYTSLFTSVLVSVLGLIVSLSRGFITGLLSLLGVGVSVGVSYLIIVLLYMIISNKKVWSTILVKLFVILGLIGLLRGIVDLFKAFYLLKGLKYGISLLFPVLLSFTTTVISSLAYMYAGFMAIYALTFAKGGRKVPLKSDEDTFNIIEDSSKTGTSATLVGGAAVVLKGSEEQSNSDFEVEEGFNVEDTDNFTKTETFEEVKDAEVKDIDVQESREEKTPKFCGDCGNKLTDNVAFCPECGTQIK